MVCLENYVVNLNNSKKDESNYFLKRFEILNQINAFLRNKSYLFMFIKGVIWSSMEYNNTDSQVLLVGSFTHQLDSKRRLIFPSVWRNLAGSDQQLFAFPHPERPCLYLYLKDEMLRRMAQLRDVNSMDADDQQAIRSITAGGELLHWDAQGRVRIGDHLLRAIDVQSQVVLVGALSRIEVWSSERYDLALPASSSVADELFFGGY